MPLPASAGQGEDALKSFQRAAAEAESPRVKADAWNNVGNVLLAGQDAQGAVQAYMNSLRLDPTDADTRYNLALAKALLQDQQEQEQQQDGEQQQGGQQQQGGEEQERPVGIQPEDAERILDLLERNEAALRAKLQAQENAKRRKAKRQKIEKDW